MHKHFKHKVNKVHQLLMSGSIWAILVEGLIRNNLCELGQQYRRCFIIFSNFGSGGHFV